MDKDRAVARIAALDIWEGPIACELLSGGRTNLNLKVTDARGSYVVRFGEDIGAHHVLRFNELAAARAAHAAGLSPAVLHVQSGLAVIEFIDGRTLQESDIQKPETLSRLVELLHKSHILLPKHLRGPALMFWVFHVIRDYAARLEEQASPYLALMPEFLQLGEELESVAGPFDIAFCHNDMLAANILDDGQRLWLIDWDYAGWGTPLFDLGGLASNSGLSPEAEREMLALYFGASVDGALFHRYHAMKTASILREVMWSMVSELTSTLDVDYASYTAENLSRFRAILSDHRNL